MCEVQILQIKVCLSYKKILMADSILFSEQAIPSVFLSVCNFTITSKEMHRELWRNCSCLQIAKIYAGGCFSCFAIILDFATITCCIE